MTTEHLTLGGVLKNLAYVPAAIAGISIGSYFVLACLLVFDIATGMWRSAIVNGGGSLKSFRALNGFFSKFLFLSVPVVIAYMGHGIGLNLNAIATASLGVLTLGTGYSILGNIYTIRTGQAVAEFDALRVILRSIEGILNKYMVPTDHK